MVTVRGHKATPPSDEGGQSFLPPQGRGCQAGRTESRSPVVWGILSFWWLAEMWACWFPLDSTSKSKTPGRPPLEPPVNPKQQKLTSLQHKILKQRTQCTHVILGTYISRWTLPSLLPTSVCPHIPLLKRTPVIVRTYPDDLVLTWPHRHRLCFPTRSHSQRPGGHKFWKTLVSSAEVPAWGHAENSVQ